MGLLKIKKPMCGCGYGIPTHSHEDLDGLRLHVLGVGSCCRVIATGDMIPKNFRNKISVDFNDMYISSEICEVNGQEITKYTLTNQRGYSYDEEYDVWSYPKSQESVNSIGDEW